MLGEQRSTMLRILMANPDIGRTALAKAAGVSFSVARSFLQQNKVEPHNKGRRKGPLNPLVPVEELLPDEPSDTIKTDFGSDKASVETTSVKITNLDQALKAAKVDLNVWEVERHVVNWWDVTYKNKEKKGVTKTNFQIKVWLKPLAKRPLQEALRELTKDLLGKGPKVKFVPVIKSADPHMLEISLFDLHFGKLAWAAETGTDYDIKISEQLFHTAIQELLARVKHFDINKILLPIGSDFFHINSQANTTVNNTAQDVDTRLGKIYKVACKMVVNAIEACLQVAPVEVIYVPGNHDRDTSFYLCSYLAAWYRQHEAVTINVNPKSRKYVQYGTTLLGFTHGDEEKVNDLPLLMAGEQSAVWGSVEHREWHIGHLHKSKELKFVAGDSHGPVIVRILPSLSGTDAWHFRKGYVCGQRAAEAYLWSFKHGYTGHLSVNVREISAQ